MISSQMKNLNVRQRATELRKVHRVPPKCTVSASNCDWVHTAPDFQKLIRFYLYSLKGEQRFNSSITNEEVEHQQSALTGTVIIFFQTYFSITYCAYNTFCPVCVVSVCQGYIHWIISRWNSGKSSTTARLRQGDIIRNWDVLYRYSLGGDQWEMPPSSS